MDKSKVNFVVDCLMFLLMMAIAGLGLLMKYVLLPGQERWGKYGRNVELYFFGLDRHAWGDIHFYLALGLLALLALHLYLHWPLVVALFRRLIAAPGVRTAAFWVFLIVSLLLLAFPLFVTPEVKDVGQGQGRQRQHSQMKTLGPLAAAFTIAEVAPAAAPMRRAGP